MKKLFHRLVIVLILLATYSCTDKTQSPEITNNNLVGAWSTPIPFSINDEDDVTVYNFYTNGQISGEYRDYDWDTETNTWKFNIAVGFNGVGNFFTTDENIVQITLDVTEQTGRRWIYETMGNYEIHADSLFFKEGNVASGTSSSLLGNWYLFYKWVDDSIQTLIHVDTVLYQFNTNDTLIIRTSKYNRNTRSGTPIPGYIYDSLRYQDFRTYYVIKDRGTDGIMDKLNYEIRNGHLYEWRDSQQIFTRQ